ncbi:uncharacterized protein B0H64DRAFT_381294 [Chaetomium fimeti]|uniref:Azaphilone pigments biosynthesis cluster protein L N-terminal domain-containing protein n=1 Tax=Chaetomium fimeti TaxID=1854472 RepID=A0AAE0LWU3_9PEZI|nr:hypothetical protein B0H64DRAFT_381294 [Chaetomium fimeti]
MADPISLASGLLALVTFALKSSTVLYDTVQSYRSHPKNVRDLKDELEALAGVLQALSETVKQNKDTDFTALKLPLLRCGNACGEFGEALAHCSSRSGGSKTSFRDWAKLKYMGDGIDEFRRMLAGYKSTINIALADANLRQSSVTIEGLETYKVMIKDATADLEDHLKSIDSKLESTFSRAADESAGDATQMRQMQEERSSTQQGLAICAQLSAHIARVQPRLAADHGQGSTDARAVPPAVAERITREGLEECQDALINTANRLEKHLKSIMDRLMARSKTALSSPQAAADLERLQEEWETARLCLDICSKANENTTKRQGGRGGYAVLRLYNRKDRTCQGHIPRAPGGAVRGATQRCVDPTDFAGLFSRRQHGASRCDAKGCDTRGGHTGGCRWRRRVLRSLRFRL